MRGYLGRGVTRVQHALVCVCEGVLSYGHMEGLSGG